MVFRRLITLSPISRYAVAVGAAVVAVGVRLNFDPTWGIRLPFITMFPAVALSAWLGGFWPGLVTTVICAASAQYLWLPPGYSCAIADLRELTIFVSLSNQNLTLRISTETGAEIFTVTEPLPVWNPSGTPTPAFAYYGIADRTSGAIYVRSFSAGDFGPFVGAP